MIKKSPLQYEVLSFVRNLEDRICRQRKELHRLNLRDMFANETLRKENLQLYKENRQARIDITAYHEKLYPNPSERLKE